MGASMIRILHVDDEPDFAELVRITIDAALEGAHTVVWEQTVAAALDHLERAEVDLVLLDLGLPDCTGTNGVARVHRRAPTAPIVMLTGTSDESTGLACIKAGATDFLSKDALDPHRLRRAIVFALARRRSAEIAELEARLDRQRSMLLGDRPLPGGEPADGTLAARAPQIRAALLRRWVTLLQAYVAFSAAEGPHPAETISHAIDFLVANNAGPDDLLAVHLDALKDATESTDPSRIHSYADAARLLAFETLSALCDRYLLDVSSQPPPPR